MERYFETFPFDGTPTNLDWWRAKLDAQTRACILIAETPTCESAEIRRQTNGTWIIIDDVLDVHSPFNSAASTIAHVHKLLSPYLDAGRPEVRR